MGISWIWRCEDVRVGRGCDGDDDDDGDDGDDDDVDDDDTAIGRCSCNYMITDCARSQVW